MNAAAAVPDHRFVGDLGIDFVELLVDDLILAILRLLAVLCLFELSEFVWAGFAGSGLFATVAALACKRRPGQFLPLPPLSLLLAISSLPSQALVHSLGINIHMVDPIPFLISHDFPLPAAYEIATQ